MAWQCHEQHKTRHAQKQQQTIHELLLPNSPWRTLKPVHHPHQLTIGIPTGTPSHEHTQRTSTATCRHPTPVIGNTEVTTTVQHQDCTCPCEHIKHSTSTPPLACSTGVTQNTAQRFAWYKRRLTIQGGRRGCRGLGEGGGGGSRITPVHLRGGESQQPAKEPGEGKG